MLGEFLKENRAELIARCRAKVATRRSPRGAAAEEPEHGVPLFLDQLSDILLHACADPPLPEFPSCPAEQRIRADATRHGGELLGQDFSVDQVVHDYGDLCQAISELAGEKGFPITVREFGILNIRLDNAIAGAVTEFERQRGVDLAGWHAQENRERLGALANAMRGFLDTSMLAVSALKGGNVGYGGSTAALLDRSLVGMRGLVDRALAEVRLGSGDAPVLEELEVGELLAGLRVGAAFEAAQKGCKLSVLVLEPDLDIRVDRHILGSAVSNLLENAFRFTRPGSHVFLKAHSLDGRVLIEVEDQCGGLPEGDAQVVFRPYPPRGAEDGSPRSGLAISRDGVQSFGGTLTARNLAGKGCVFTIDLPRVGARAHGAGTHS